MAGTFSEKVLKKREVKAGKKKKGVRRLIRNGSRCCGGTLQVEYDLSRN